MRYSLASIVHRICICTDIYRKSPICIRGMRCALRSISFHSIQFTVFGIVWHVVLIVPMGCLSLLLLSYFLQLIFNMMFSILRHWHCLLSLSSLWLPPALRKVNIQSIGYHSAWTRVILPSNNYGFLLCLSAALLFPTPFSLFSPNFFSSLLMIFFHRILVSLHEQSILYTENRTDEQWTSSLPTVQRNIRSKFIIFFLFIHLLFRWHAHFISSISITYFSDVESPMNVC